jgi:hypothetical protein
LKARARARGARCAGDFHAHEKKSWRIFARRPERTRARFVDSEFVSARQPGGVTLRAGLVTIPIAYREK